VRHQRSHLPELAEIAGLQPARDDLDDQRRDARIVVDDLEVERTKVESDVAAVRTRRTRDQDRMDLITSPKDLERMQGELVSLQRRIATLEDEELEVMVRLEEAQATLDDLTAQVEQADARLAELIAGRDEKAAALDVDLRAVEAERAPVAAEIPDDLLALYEKLRVSKGGVAAAELRQRACGGCRLTVDNAELSRIAGTAPDQVVRCEECSRIMVRTAESGL
jgi:predicted  nucleic acid-binding Zn-ribbon protein